MVMDVLWTVISYFLMALLIHDIVLIGSIIGFSCCVAIETVNDWVRAR